MTDKLQFVVSVVVIAAFMYALIWVGFVLEAIFGPAIGGAW